MSVAAYQLILVPIFTGTLLAHELSQVSSAAATTAQTLELELVMAIDSLENLAGLKEFRTLDQPQIERALELFDATTPFFIYTWALDSQGRVIAAPSRPDRIGEDRSGRDYFVRPTPRNPTHFQKVQVSTRGRFSLVIGTVVLGPEGEKVGALAGSLGLMDRNPQMYRAILDTPFPGPYQVFLVTANNILLAHSDKRLPQPSPEALKSLGKQPFMEHFDAGAEEAQLVSHKGKKYIIGFAEVPASDWVVVVQVPEPYILGAVEEITTGLSILLGVLLLATLFVGLFFAERFSGTLGKLTMALGRYGELGEAYNLPSVQGKGELHDALRAFNRMVTDRTKAEARLQESESRFRTLVEHAADAFFLHDLEGRLLDVNQHACDSLGYSREELLSMSVDDLDPVSVSAGYKGGIWKELGPDSPVTVEGVHRRKDGTTFPVEVHLGMLVSDSGKRILALARNITERKKKDEILQRAKESLERQNEELRKIDRIKDGLLRDVSHELKTPVAKYAMQLEILKPIMEKHGLTEEERKAFIAMEESQRRQEGVIKGLLDLSRLEGGGRKFNRVILRLDELIEKVIDDYRVLIEKNGGIINAHVPPVKIKSDGEMLWHLFSNILGNAIKFRKEDGALRISVTADTGDGFVKVQVADEGMGFTEEERAKAFDRFYQSTASSEGSGVGLAICKMIVDGVGGKISIHSEGKGRGAVVSVTLPLS